MRVQRAITWDNQQPIRGIWSDAVGDCPQRKSFNTGTAVLTSSCTVSAVQSNGGGSKLTAEEDPGYTLVEHAQGGTRTQNNHCDVRHYS